LITAWRIVKNRYVTAAFDGEGARLTGGRWTSAGRRAVYVASTRALAALEMLAHLGSSAPLAAYALIEVGIPDRLITSLDAASLPADWNAFPSPPALRALGDEWLAARASAVLRVPSALTGEANYILNPEHPDFPLITRHAPVPFIVDPRLVK